MNDSEKPICRLCAEQLGWKPKDKPVGIWRDVCLSCGRLKDVTAVRDYIRVKDE